MAYAVLQNLVDRFGQTELDQVADTTNTGVLDVARVDRALGDAAAEIDAALIGRYSLPLVTVPDLLERIACDLARESLYEDQPTETVKDRAKRARDQLLGIASGKLGLDVPKAAIAESTSGLVEIVTGRRASPFIGFGD